jgi:hypothetical protein
MDNWGWRITRQQFISAILLIIVAEVIVAIVPAISSLGIPGLILGSVGVPIFILVAAFINTKRLQAQIRDVLTTYEYHWIYRPGELVAFAELFRREKWTNFFRLTSPLLITYPHIQGNRIADEVYISRTQLYEIGGRLVPLRVPLTDYFPVFSEQLTTLQHQFEISDGEGGKTTYEIWILVPGSEADHFRPNAKRGIAALKGIVL